MTKTNIRTEKQIDVYQQVTARIINALESGVRPWLQPWANTTELGGVSLPKRHNDLDYQGINVLVLWFESFRQGFISPHWMTFKQAQTLKGLVQRGERSTKVVYAGGAGKIEKQETIEKQEKVKDGFFFIKQYSVFNAEQVKGLEEKFYRPVDRVLNTTERIKYGEDFFSRIGADIRFSGTRAYYSQDGDFIKLPQFDAFHSAKKQLAVLAHEVIHWTAHPLRLDRDLGGRERGDPGYAQEELVAEIGSAFLCAKLGLTPAIQDQHAPYIDNWLKALQNDKQYISKAASYAQRAVDYLLNLSQEVR